MKLKNLTPHSLTLVGENGTLVVPPSGNVARLAVTRTALNSVIIDGVTLSISLPVMGEIEGLPAAESGVILVVSALVAGAANRPDVMSPGELLRDGGGNVIGARGLCNTGKCRMRGYKTLGQMMAEYAAKSAALTAAYDAECNAQPTAEEIRRAETRRAEIAEQEIRREEIAEDNAKAVDLLRSMLPLTAEQVEKLPHTKTELVNSKNPEFGAVLKSYRAPSRYGAGTSTYSWAAVVKTQEITLEMVCALQTGKPVLR